ncbi:MAG: G-D-S-L family lipolytic protein [Bacteroidetes bacterium]|jgi:lysophospholipase L1-like esterase|nr:MAG: G-D-S-L family lipolytic protein [Bacteroidota bacterium]
MKKFLFPFVFALFAFAPQKKTKVIFFGDSITQQGVNPGGYVTRIDSMCRLEGMGDKFEFIGAGIGGNKVYDLYLRMDDDVLAKNPDIVIIYIGVNDVWHKATSGTGTDPDKFEKFYTAILKKLKDRNIKVILCTPAAIGEKTDFSNQQDGDMNAYSNIIRGLAQKNNLPLVDLRKIFLDYDMKNNPENKDRGILTIDKVHLNAKGNQLVADEMWKLIKVAGN